LNIFIRSGDIRRQTSKSTEIGPNFACFWPLNFFWVGSFKILDRDYKIERSTEHRAKFRADRPTELGDYARKKEKNTAKHKSAPQAIASGRTNKRCGKATITANRGAASVQVFCTFFNHVKIYTCVQ